MFKKKFNLDDMQAHHIRWAALLFCLFVWAVVGYAILKIIG